MKDNVYIYICKTVKINLGYIIYIFAILSRMIYMSISAPPGINDFKCFGVYRPRSHAPINNMNTD